MSQPFFVDHEGRPVEMNTTKAPEVEDDLTFIERLTREAQREAAKQSTNK